MFLPNGQNVTICLVSYQTKMAHCPPNILRKSQKSPIFDQKCSRLVTLRSGSTEIQFQPELLYSGQGIKPNTGPEGNFGFDVNGVPERPFDERAELDYIQLPLLIKKNFGKFNIHLGPQVGIAVWNSYNNGIYKNFDYSGIGGIGVQIFDFLALEARYSVGFRNDRYNSVKYCVF